MSSDEALQAFRRDIDAIDDQIISLLKNRSSIVQKVGALKHGEAPGRCPIRPGREAEQLRKVVKAFAGGPFPPAAAADIWRTIIMGSLAVEGDIKLSVYAPDATRDLFWAAREYFGPFSVYSRQPTPKRVIGDLLDGKAQVGVLPPLDETTLRWWTELVGTNTDRPQIFACLPFVLPQRPSRDIPMALAVGRITPEETGNDISYVVIDTDELASQHRMQAAFTQSGIEPRWLEIYNPTPGKRMHVMELKGFINQGSERYAKFAEVLGSSLINTVFLGSHAAPIILD